MPRSYHPGELSVQTQAGSLAQASKLARTVHSDVPDPLARFLETLNWILIGAAAIDGRVWASPLFGPAGFIEAIGEGSVTIHGHPDRGDPLYDLVGDPTPRAAGLLAIDLGRRMRARINGRLRTDAEGMTVTIDECYANCPKYIHRRVVSNDPGAANVVRTETEALPEAGLALLRGADTAFVATVGPDHSADTSHRGGPPGFLEHSADGRVIRFDDQPGNGVFNTLGNLNVDDRAGLTVIGFDTGEVLQMTGRATVITASDTIRAVEFTVERVVHTANGPFVSSRLDEADRQPPALD